MTLVNYLRQFQEGSFYPAFACMFMSLFVCLFASSFTLPTDWIFMTFFPRDVSVGNDEPIKLFGSHLDFFLKDSSNWLISLEKM